MIDSQRALLAGAIDYAGLFPPASLDMAQAAGNYRRYLASEDRWALNRFICPVGRLQELAIARGHGGDPWRIAAAGSGEPYEEAAAIARFNQDYYGRLRVEAIEAKTPDAHAVATRVAAHRGLECFCELNPAAPEFRSTAEAVQRAGVHAKLRTGGVVAEAIPSLELVLHFLTTCHDLGISFKATAGLHHPFCGSYPLTYEPDAQQALMYGFLNLALAATALASGADPSRAAELLAAADPWSLTPDPWPLSSIEAGRHFFLGFGSCSFEEPLLWLRPPA